ncbi:hypothetical protein [Kaarinaea lacus]
MNFRIIIVYAVCLFTPVSVYASKSDIGLTCDKEIIGVNRYITIGDTVSYTLEFMEQNNYRCGEFLGRVREIVSCSYRLDRKYEILLTIEEGKVTMIETRLEGVECN